MARFFPTRWTDLAKALDELPDRTRDAVRILAANGWYLDPHASFVEVDHAIERFERGDIADAHQYQCEYYRERLDGIEAELCDRFPDRARILTQAFAAHRRGEYALSIPVFLAQSDGICQELVGEQLYAKQGDGTPKVAARLELDKEMALGVSYKAALMTAYPISMSAKGRAGLVNFLNRHMVLHGESCDYDTPLNSWRSISLIAYVAWILDKRP